MSFHVVYKSLLFYIQGVDFTIGNSLFGSANLTKNIDSEKYCYSVYAIGFDGCRSFSLTDGSGFGKNLIISGAGMSSSVHIDNKMIDILILSNGTINGLDDTTLTAENEYFIIFSDQQKTFCLSFHYNGVDSYIFVNRVEIYIFKAKDSEINAGLLYLEKISKS